MARKKVKLAYIENETARKVTYKKRAKGVLKKTKELSVLCDVDACTVIYGPYDHEPMVWPSNKAQARRILKEYKRKPPMDQAQRCFNQQTYLKQSVAKAQERLEKLQRRNREMEMEVLMSDLIGGRKPFDQINPNDFPDLLWVIDDKLKTIGHRISVLEERSDTEADGDASNDAVNAGASASASANANSNAGDPVVANINVNFDDGVNEGGGENPRALNETMGNTQHWDLPSPSGVDWLFLP